MTMQAIASPTRPVTAQAAMFAYIATAGLVFLLIMLIGVVMRMAQAQWLNVDPGFFYVLMTMHGAGRTFLFPLPAISGFQWSLNAAAAYLVGLLLIGVGFLLFYLDVARGAMSVYGGLGNALGVKQALGLAPAAEGAPAAVTARQWY